MKPTRLIPICLLLLFITPQFLFSQKCPDGQSFQKKKKTGIISELSVSFGGSHYFGDLNSFNQSDRKYTGELHKENMSFAFGLNYRLYFSRFVNPRISLLYTRLSGSDRDNEVKKQFSTTWFRQFRNLTFRTDVLELSVLFEINLIGFRPGDTRKRFSPYLLAGVGFIYFDPKAPYNDDWMSHQTDEVVSTIMNSSDYEYNTWIRLQPLGTEGQGLPGYPDKYKLIQPNYTIGLGLKYNVSSSVTLSWEVSHHFTFTDYLDDVSTVYPDPSDYYAYYGYGKAQIASNLSIRSKEIDPAGDYSHIIAEGQQRGSPKFKDSYMVSIITVGYVLNNKKTSNMSPKRIQKLQDKKTKKEEKEDQKNREYQYYNKRSSKTQDLTKK